MISFLITALFVSGGCDKSENGKDDVNAFKGVVINEIAAHDQTTDAESWVEILNTGAESVDVSGLGLFLTDQYFSCKCLYTAPAGTVLSQERDLCCQRKTGHWSQESPRIRSSS